MWDALTGAELKVLNGHTGTIYCVAFSSDSTYIISGSHDHSVRVWDAFTGIELKVLNGHTSPVFSIAFSTDGTRIVSGSAAPNSVRVWDASIETDFPASVMPNFHTNSINSITSPTAGTLDEESAQLYIVDRAYPAWTNDTQTGWINSILGGYRLMWVPEQAYPYSIIIISRGGSAIINFQNCKIGCNWAGCYIPSQAL